MESVSKGLFSAPDPTQLNWTQLVELNRIGRSDHAYDSTKLNSTDSNWYGRVLQVLNVLLLVELSCRHDHNARSDKTEVNLVAASCDPVGYFAACAIGHSIVYAEVSSIIMNYNNNYN